MYDDIFVALQSILFLSWGGGGVANCVLNTKDSTKFFTK